jgi:hypothetical protein
MTDKTREWWTVVGTVFAVAFYIFAVGLTTTSPENDRLAHQAKEQMKR